MVNDVLMMMAVQLVASDVIFSLHFPQWSAVSPHNNSEWIPPPGWGLHGFLVGALKTVWIIGHSEGVSVGMKCGLSPYASPVMNGQPVFQLMTTETHPQSHITAIRTIVLIGNKWMG